MLQTSRSVYVFIIYGAFCGFAFFSIKPIVQAASDNKRFVLWKSWVPSKFGVCIRHSVIMRLTEGRVTRDGLIWCFVQKDFTCHVLVQWNLIRGLTSCSVPSWTTAVANGLDIYTIIIIIIIAIIIIVFRYSHKHNRNCINALNGLYWQTFTICTKTYNSKL